MNVNGINGGRQFEPYNNMGFYLGNGLFYDLNDNLGILVDKLYEIDEDETFEIIEQVSPQRKNRYTRDRNEFKRRFGSIFGGSQITKFETDKEDGAFVIRQSLASKEKLYETEDGGLLLKFPLGKTEIQYDGKGYTVKRLFGRQNYVKIGNGVNLDGRYFIQNNGNKIEIYESRGFSGRQRLIFTLIRSKDNIYLLENENRGLKIVHEGDKIEFFRNRTTQVIYEREK